MRKEVICQLMKTRRDRTCRHLLLYSDHSLRVQNDDSEIHPLQVKPNSYHHSIYQINQPSPRETYVLHTFH